MSYSALTAVGFSRAFAVDVLVSQQKLNLSEAQRLTNQELAAALCVHKIVSPSYLAGVFTECPTTLLDARTVMAVTGNTADVVRYHQQTTQVDLQHSHWYYDTERNK